MNPQPSEITIDQFRDLAERMMVDMKVAKDLSVAPFSHVGVNVREWFTTYEYGIFTSAYNAGYDDGNVDATEHASHYGHIDTIVAEPKAGKSWLLREEETDEQRGRQEEREAG